MLLSLAETILARLKIVWSVMLSESGQAELQKESLLTIEIEDLGVADHSGRLVRPLREKVVGKPLIADYEPPSPRLRHRFWSATPEFVIMCDLTLADEFPVATRDYLGESCFRPCLTGRP